MKPGSSSLNPYAAAYIPLSARGKNVNTEFPNNMVNDAESDKQILLSGQLSKLTLDRNDHGNEKLSVPEGLPLNSQQSYAPYSSSTQAPNLMGGDPTLHEEVEMELEYLQMIYPGISVQFLNEAYFLQGCDLEATMEMLNHLESSHSDHCSNLPDTLDIGDVPDSSSPANQSSLKLDTVTGEASTSATSPSDPAVPA